MTQTRVVGLTGGIGSGKSTVADMLRALGAAIIDADRIVHELQAPGMPMLAELAAAFGDHVITEDGALDRKALGAIVFQDTDKRIALGRIVHPQVGMEMLRQVTVAKERGAPLAVADIPLLFEGRMEGRDTAAALGVEGVILSWVPRDMQIERTMERDRCTRDEALARIRAQLPIDEKRGMAEWVVDNSGDLDDTRRQVEALFRELVSAPGSPG